MGRPVISNEISSEGQDSFLDVITNIVGILIILVMVIGGRVQQITISANPNAAPAIAGLSAEVESLGKKAFLVEREIEELLAQAAAVTESAMLAQSDRMRLAESVAAVKLQVEEQKKLVDAKKVAAAEGKTKLAKLTEEINKLDREMAALAHAPATTKEVLAYPTPIGRTVNGDEIHFQIDGGRLAYIPIDELFELARTRTQRHSGSISQLADRIESVGPAKGFMLDYVIEAKVDQARGQVLVRSREWVVRSVDAGIGETAEEALAASSQFRAALARIRPDTTVTIWCYPDSFETFRKIRTELHRLGVPTACRPLPDGAPIGGSTEGSKSVAQ